MAQIPWCQAGSFPFTYIGLPIVKNMRRKSSWNTIIDKFKAKLSTWKSNLLSIGGRYTLIKSVLGSLGIYYLSLFKAPQVVIHTLERLRSRFFWRGNDSINKMAWIKWENVVAPMEHGGLGIGSLHSFNLALLQKWHWRLVNQPNQLWVKLIKSIHGLEAGFDGNGCYMQGLWADIVGSSYYLHSRNLIPKDVLKCNIGTGRLFVFGRTFGLEMSHWKPGITDYLV